MLLSSSKKNKENLWNSIIKAYGAELPQFNDELLINFRKNAMEHIPEYLEDVFIGICDYLNDYQHEGKPKLEYLGYVIPAPDEVAKYMATTPMVWHALNIRESTVRIFKYEFKFGNEIIPMYVDIPYMSENAITITDVPYYPQLIVTDRGGIAILDNGIIIKVAKGNIICHRTDRVALTTVEGMVISELNITSKVHQKALKKNSTIPAILNYNLAKRPFKDVMETYGYGDSITFVNVLIEDPLWCHIDIGNNCFIKFKSELLVDNKAKRILVSLHATIKQYKSFKLSDLFNVTYYLTVIGKLTYDTVDRPALQLYNATKCVKANDRLDKITLMRLAAHGVHVKNLDELLTQVWHSIDKWIVAGANDSVNLLDKKFAELEHLLISEIYKLNLHVFSIVNRTPNGMEKRDINPFFKKGNTSRTITTSAAYISSPQLYNTNWLISVGDKRLVTRDLIETSKKDNKETMPKHYKKAHASQLAVYDIMAYPSSNPIQSGSINPFVKTDEFGNIQTPDNWESIKHVFD